MPTPEGRAGNIVIWFITCFFFILILVGGAFLVLYVTLPESEGTLWFPVAGTVLIAIPWLFWIATCMYRSFAPAKPAAAFGIADRHPVRAATIAPSGGGGGATSVGTDSPVDSPGGARRVRFGVATVMGPEDGSSGGAAVDGHEADGDSHATGVSNGTSNDDGSSVISHESERPLALSLS